MEMELKDGASLIAYCIIAWRNFQIMNCNFSQSQLLFQKEDSQFNYAQMGGTLSNGGRLRRFAERYFTTNNNHLEKQLIQY